MASRKTPAVLSDCRFDADGAVGLDLPGARFEDCAFDRCALGGRDLRGARFVDCVFTGCDLTVAKVVNAAFVRVRFRECRLAGIHWSVASKLESVAFEGCQLNDGTFLGLSLEGCESTRCVARGASFRDAKLAGATFRGSDLAMVEFVNCDLRGADFRGAHDYTLSPAENRLEKARFSLPEAMGLLKGLGIILE